MKTLISTGRIYVFGKKDGAVSKTLKINSAQAISGATLSADGSIYILSGNKIVQLKPVEVVSWEKSYLYQEYGVGPEELTRFRKRMESRRRHGKYVIFKGKFDPKRLG